MQRLLVSAVFACFVLAQATAKMVECKYNPSGIGYSDACLLPSQPSIPDEIGGLMESIMEQVETLTGLPLGGLRCHDDDLAGAVSKTYYIPDDMNPICYTMLYEVDLTLPETQMNFRLLFRGAWGRTDEPEELEYKTCYDMCNYIKRAGTVSIHMVHAGPLYLGCYHSFNANDEILDDLVYPPEIDCTPYGPPTSPTRSLTTTRAPAHVNGGGNATPWIVFGVLTAVLVVLVVLVGVGAVFWWFRLRTQ